MGDITQTKAIKKVVTSEITPEDLIALCDHTFLNPPEVYRKAEAAILGAVRDRRGALDSYLKEVLQAKVFPYALCVRAEDVSYVRHITAGRLPIAATVGFPDGPRHSTSLKVAQAKMACAEGACEIDMVCNYEAAQRGDWNLWREDIESVQEVVNAVGGTLKVILETSELTLEHTEQACKHLAVTDVAFVKTSTGFSRAGANIEHLRIMHAAFPRGIKLSGGIRNHNVRDLLSAVSDADGTIAIDPSRVRIGESTLFHELNHG